MFFLCKSCGKNEKNACFFNGKAMEKLLAIIHIITNSHISITENHPSRFGSPSLLFYRPLYFWISWKTKS